MISVQGLRKSYGDHTVLDGVDLDVATGTVWRCWALTAPGKTTMVNVAFRH
jgi:ABC-2 type transport system ATP-binding protein